MSGTVLKDEPFALTVHKTNIIETICTYRKIEEFRTLQTTK